MHKLLISFTIFFIGQGLFANEYFPLNYQVSRRAFIEEVYKSKAASTPMVDKFYVPSPSVLDTDLSVDYAYFPATEDKKNLILLVSGIHGPETYAGAAVQMMFLREYFPKINFKNTGVILIHALNPYGFKYHRRASENNVNLNRNFDVDQSLFKIENKGYEKLKDLLEPKGPVTNSTTNSYSTSAKLLAKIAFKQATVDELTEAVARGQYKSYEGIEYGGSRFEPQVGHFKSYLTEKFALYSKIVSVSLHTGLGKEETLHLITGRFFNEENKKFLQELYTPTEGTELSNEDAEGFYRVYGDFADFTQQISDSLKGKKFVAVTMEYGTIGNGLSAKLSSVNRMILENQGHHFGYATKNQEEKVKRRFMELYYPDSQSWKDQVIEKARDFFDQIVKNLK
jgi:hypothetical protein